MKLIDHIISGFNKKNIFDKVEMLKALNYAKRELLAIMNIELNDININKIKKSDMITEIKGRINSILKEYFENEK